MPTVTFILGLCGSGKTWLAENLHAQTGGQLFDEPIGRNQESTIVETLRNGGDCIVEEFFYCVQHHRDKMLARLKTLREVEVRFICYENDLESANWNVRRRTNKARVQEHLELNRRISPHYTLPVGCERRAIVRIS